MIAAMPCRKIKQRLCVEKEVTAPKLASRPEFTWILKPYKGIVQKDGSSHE